MSTSAVVEDGKQPEAKTTLQDNNNSKNNKGTKKAPSSWAEYVLNAIKSDDPIPVDLLELRARNLVKDIRLPQSTADLKSAEEATGANLLNKPTREGGVASCKLCGVTSFEGGFEEQRRHFKSQWHEINRALAAQKRPAISEQESLEMVRRDAEEASKKLEDPQGEEDLDESSSSISDLNEDEEEEEVEDDVSKIGLITDSRWTICTLQEATEYSLGLRSVPAIASDESELVSLLQSKDLTWAIMLYRSGHFAASMLRNGQLIKHKTEHRYTQRRKQGGSQAAQDEKGFKARSAGAMLRRYGEQTMRERVSEVLGSWDWTQCDRIFLGVPEKCRKLFIRSEKKSKRERTEVRFEKSDGRVRKVPFITGRPTLSECERVYKSLLRLELFVIDRVYPPQAAAAPSEEEAPPSVIDPQLGKEKEEQPLSEFRERRIHQIILDPSDNVDALEMELDASADDLDAQNADGETPLHLACSFPNRIKCMSLLLETGADLLVKDIRGRSPYQRIRDKAVKHIFLKIAQNRHQEGGDFTWEEAGMPLPASAKTEDELEAKRAKEREKKKRQAERKRQEAREREALLAAEKERLEAERKAIELAGACSECHKAMPKKKSERFKQGEKEFCSVACVRVHTRRLAADAAERRLRGEAS